MMEVLDEGLRDPGFCSGYVVSDSTEGSDVLGRDVLKVGDVVQGLWGTLKHKII